MIEEKEEEKEEEDGYLDVQEYIPFKDSARSRFVSFERIIQRFGFSPVFTRFSPKPAFPRFMKRIIVIPEPRLSTFLLFARGKVPRRLFDILVQFQRFYPTLHTRYLTIFVDNNRGEILHRLPHTRSSISCYEKIFQVIAERFVSTLLPRSPSLTSSTCAHEP